ncbi:MAG: organoarsenical effux MFS transporter ArsJ [Gammaproteobacteria bacterium]|nr:organoarsenical effux MFS transporter ArsJ [Gammaproteobacteria bacterium]
MDQGIRNYLVVTGGYWAFTITDGAIRMLVVLFFHQLGYTPFEIASLFLFYEFFGIVTNLVGGWLGARLGLNLTMHIGMALQIVALTMLAVNEAWLTVPFVMLAQAMSGIAKDLNKMSAKASVKLMLPEDGRDDRLFKWVAVLTGSKNSLKGAGFFIGGLLLQLAGFQGALYILAGLLAIVLVLTWFMLPNDIGKTKAKAKFSQVFSKSAAINWLSAARFFLFGARDVWFVVSLPVFLVEVMDWNFSEVGGFLALWIIGYGFVQASAPGLIRKSHHGAGPDGRTALYLVGSLLLIPAVMAVLLATGYSPAMVLIAGLAIFGAVFALNSAVHSYLVVAWSDREKVSMNVGFYYMANAGGRLAGTILSGLSYQAWGMTGSLWLSAGFLLMAMLLSFRLPATKKPVVV